MIQLCYISTVRPQFGEEIVDDILRASRRNNACVGVTGLLLFNGRRFLQLLEGPADAVATTFARIEKDKRHFAIVKLSEQPIEEREFGRWDMSYELFAADRGKPTIIEQVKQLTNAASPNIRALFTSYAAI